MKPLILVSITAAVLLCGTPALAELHQATGIKVGEVDDRSAIVWVRMTRDARRNDSGTPTVDWENNEMPSGLTIDQLEGACPGMSGKVRLRYSTEPTLADATLTEWVNVDAADDYAHQFRLENLEPGTVYYYVAETASDSGSETHEPLRGRFKTAMPADAYQPVTFTVVTGQMYKHLDNPNGYLIYDQMRELNPDFHVLTGDTVYYDNELPVSNTVDLARYEWHRMYSLPALVQFHLQVPAYWEKDDHDTVHNDCWPGKQWDKMLPMTFDKGVKLFLEQVPMGKRTYRTFRWGKGLQIWLVEGRDFRSPNPMEDGPDKTIWGTEQKKWLKETILASDADWKILISPTPIVGPDRKGKSDNHANEAFSYEGNQIRRWIAEHELKRMFVVCGDRHWQYHSVDPETGVQEFSCGPASDIHAGGSPGKDPEYHKYHQVKGGFLAVKCQPTENSSRLSMQFYDVHGRLQYQYDAE